ncbi:MAG: HD domain-containing protein [Ignavibacteria bacterium]|nr:HD domain-containing protein [Ignavibacteria bacterium]
MFSEGVLFKELFKGFIVLRWNDKLRPIELIEMDKHAHKMMIAWVIGKYEEKKGKKVDWHNIIRGGVFELLRRIVLRDIKNPIYFRIQKEFKDIYRKLNQWVYDYFTQKISNSILLEELKAYLIEEDLLDEFSSKILASAHKYSSYLEFLLIKQINPTGFEIQDIERSMYNDIYQYLDLEGIQKLVTRQKVADFIELCGQLRFQIRWSQTPRIPRTSVLGHSMFVATATYFFARDNNACPQRIYNNFFGGLFHDLPETLTRDIISPVKTSSEDFQRLIWELEQQLAEKHIYPLIEDEWIDELRYFTLDEFTNKIKIDGKITPDLGVEEINQKYNEDYFEPYDGELIRAADQMAAFLEAKTSIDYGVKSSDLSTAVEDIPKRYCKSIGQVDFRRIYEQLESNDN